ncbi:sugar phosphate isomerase/epimerase [Mesorhizobium sp. B2-4-9]|uniref:sugar phosphate isomerase/epimerase family protein n=1 Tax=Mesorhizobium sp. B2-4-9 TaxID=2589940 RepID=UPI0011283F8C|nr:sugar phosphate isomerase/epimerase family protein [Mesorhizobium sp. B2-4-9]TPL21068.1 sugar phosphate isomerase/epimerase [Mesorhizobium sp. B2-4-9]
MVSTAAEAGFGAVGLRLEPAIPEEARFPMLGGAAMMKETKRRLRDTGLRVLDAEVFRLISGQSFNRYRPALEACAELGVSELLTTCNIKDRSEAADLLTEACDVANEYGLNINIEFMPWQALNDLKTAIELLRSVDRENGVLLVDTLHVHRSNVPLEELAAVDPARMRYIQICDATTPPPDFDTMLFQARFERLMPGDGVIPLQSYLEVLPKTLPVSAEVPMRTRLAEIGPLALAKEAYVKTRQALDQADW